MEVEELVEQFAIGGSGGAGGSGGVAGGSGTSAFALVLALACMSLQCGPFNGLCLCLGFN